MAIIDRNINSLFHSVTYRMKSIVIDPGDTQHWEGTTDILLTHAHFDHIYGLNELIAQAPEARILTNEHGRRMLLDDKLNMSRYHETPFRLLYLENICIVDDNEVITLADGMEAQAFFTPGHNPSCITWRIGDMLFTGDSYIPGIKTVTNLPGGDKQQARASESLIKSLSSGLVILPGHNV